ncbi:hypothetical protein Lal_00020933 [Lupinus albus]|nr:hypothetical protein Lal_00020933 [Lupinus albus]
MIQCERQKAESSNRQISIQQYQPLQQEKSSKLEDTKNQFMHLTKENQKNKNASLKIQIGELVKQISENEIGAFNTNIGPNPKVQCNVVKTRGGKVVDYDVDDHIEDEKLVVEKEKKMSK